MGLHIILKYIKDGSEAMFRLKGIISTLPFPYTRTEGKRRMYIYKRFILTDSMEIEKTRGRDKALQK